MIYSVVGLLFVLSALAIAANAGSFSFSGAYLIPAGIRTSVIGDVLAIGMVLLAVFGIVSLIAYSVYKNLRKK